MTAYWDDLRHQVQDASDLANEEFLDRVCDLEAQVIETVSLTTGDREFPEALREKVQGIIATNAIDFGRFVARSSSYGRRVREVALPINERARAWLLTMRYSILFEELHMIFHYVAQQRVPNRYDSYFTDDPSSFVHARDGAEGTCPPDCDHKWNTRCALSCYEDEHKTSC